MSYNITYNPELKRKYPIERKNNNNPLKIVVITLVGFIAVYGLTKAGIMHYLIPGDPEITVDAFSTMVNRVSQGEAVGNAIAAFCREIICSN